MALTSIFSMPHVGDDPVARRRRGGRSSHMIDPPRSPELHRPPRTEFRISLTRNRKAVMPPGA